MSPYEREAWDLEATPSERPDDSGVFMISQPTGWLTFRCRCGTPPVNGKGNDVLVKAREHLRTEHPAWEQIPGDVVFVSGEDV